MKISMNKNLGAVLDKMMCRCRLKPSEAVSKFQTASVCENRQK